jgi:hypothetical protein
MSIELTSLSSNKIKQYDSDPTSPKIETAWVLRTVGAGGSTEGMPMGLLLALTYATTSAGGGATTYQFSYRTKEGSTKRATIS